MSWIREMLSLYITITLTLYVYGAQTLLPVPSPMATQKIVETARASTVFPPLYNHSLSDQDFSVPVALSDEQVTFVEPVTTTLDLISGSKQTIALVSDSLTLKEKIVVSIENVKHTVNCRPKYFMPYLSVATKFVPKGLEEDGYTYDSCKIELPGKVKDARGVEVSLDVPDLSNIFTKHIDFSYASLPDKYKCGHWDATDLDICIRRVITPKHEFGYFVCTLAPAAHTVADVCLHTSTGTDCVPIQGSGAVAEVSTPNGNLKVRAELPLEIPDEFSSSDIVMSYDYSGGRLMVTGAYVPQSPLPSLGSPSNSGPGSVQISRHPTLSNPIPAPLIVGDQEITNINNDISSDCSSSSTYAGQKYSRTFSTSTYTLAGSPVLVLVTTLARSYYHFSKGRAARYGPCLVVVIVAIIAAVVASATTAGVALGSGDKKCCAVIPAYSKDSYNDFTKDWYKLSKVWGQYGFDIPSSIRTASTYSEDTISEQNLQVDHLPSMKVDLEMDSKFKLLHSRGTGRVSKLKIASMALNRNGPGSYIKVSFSFSGQSMRISASCSPAECELIHSFVDATAGENVALIPIASPGAYSGTYTICIENICANRKPSQEDFFESPLGAQDVPDHLTETASKGKSLGNLITSNWTSTLMHVLIWALLAACGVVVLVLVLCFCKYYCTKAMRTNYALVIIYIIIPLLLSVAGGTVPPPGSIITETTATTTPPTTPRFQGNPNHCGFTEYFDVLSLSAVICIKDKNGTILYGLTRGCAGYKVSSQNYDVWFVYNGFVKKNLTSDIYCYKNYGNDACLDQNVRPTKYFLPCPVYNSYPYCNSPVDDTKVPLDMIVETILTSHDSRATKYEVYKRFYGTLAKSCPRIAAIQNLGLFVDYLAQDRDHIPSAILELSQNLIDIINPNYDFCLAVKESYNNFLHYWDPPLIEHFHYNIRSVKASVPHTVGFKVSHPVISFSPDESFSCSTKDPGCDINKLKENCHFNSTYCIADTCYCQNVIDSLDVMPTGEDSYVTVWAGSPSFVCWPLQTGAVCSPFNNGDGENVIHITGHKEVKIMDTAFAIIRLVSAGTFHLTNVKSAITTYYNYNHIDLGETYGPGLNSSGIYYQVIYCSTSCVGSVLSPRLTSVSSSVRLGSLLYFTSVITPAVSVGGPYRCQELGLSIDGKVLCSLAGHYALVDMTTSKIHALYQHSLTYSHIVLDENNTAIAAEMDGVIGVSVMCTGDIVSLKGQLVCSGHCCVASSDSFITTQIYADKERVHSNGKLHFGPNGADVIVTTTSKNECIVDQYGSFDCAMKMHPYYFWSLVAVAGFCLLIISFLLIKAFCLRFKIIAKYVAKATFNYAVFMAKRNGYYTDSTGQVQKFKGSSEDYANIQQATMANEFANIARKQM